MRKSNFSVSIQINGKKTATEYLHNNEVFIEGRKGSDFSIFFQNHSNSKVLIVPAIDGISTLDGKQAGPDSPGLIVQAYSNVTIPGWMVDNSTAAQFKFADVKKGYGGDNANAGVIGILVFYEKVAAYQPSLITTRRVMPYQPSIKPWDLPPMTPYYGVCGTNLSFSSAQASTDLSTEWGKATEFETTKTEFEKGNLAETLVIYYGSRKYLEEVGIVFEKKTYNSRPTAFPGYGCTPPKGWTGK